MRYFYEVQEGSKWYEACDKMMNWKNEWAENRLLKDFFKRLGVNKEDFLLGGNLRVLKVPKGYEKQFCKPRIQKVKVGNEIEHLEVFRARENSILNKEYRDIVTTSNLKMFGWWDFKDLVGMSLVDPCGFSISERQGKFYIIDVTDNLLAKNLQEGLKELSEIEWLEIDLKFKKATTENQVI